MAETDTAAAAPAAPAAPAEPGKPATAETVPYSRFAEVNDGYQSLKAELAETQKKLRERDEAEMSAADREKAARERAELERDSASAETEKFKRSRIIAKAARDAGFTDPDFAAEHLANENGIETDAQAAKAVEALAKRVPGLVKQDPPTPQLGQVLANGAPVDPKTATEAQAKKQFEDDLRDAVGFPTA